MSWSRRWKIVVGTEAEEADAVVVEVLEVVETEDVQMAVEHAVVVDEGGRSEGRPKRRRSM